MENMSEQYEVYIKTGIMPEKPDWEIFKAKGYKDLEYYSDEYNIMRLEDQWIRERLTEDNMDQVFGMVEIGRTDDYSFINEILGEDIVWSVQKRFNYDISKPNSIHLVNVYGIDSSTIKSRLKNIEYRILKPYLYIINTAEHGVINLHLMSSNNVSVSKYYHNHNMRYNPFSIVYKGIEYMTKRQLFYKNNKKQYYIEIGVNDKKFCIFGRKDIRIPKYVYNKMNEIIGLDKKIKYVIKSDISLSTFWALITSGYQITLTSKQRRIMRSTKYKDMDEFIQDIRLNDPQYVKLEC